LGVWLSDFFSASSGEVVRSIAYDGKQEVAVQAAFDKANAAIDKVLSK
jgi:hypothetical protein